MAQPSGKGRIVVSGILFWYPLAGVTYQFLHYLLGLRRLGVEHVDLVQVHAPDFVFVRKADSSTLRARLHRR